MSISHFQREIGQNQKQEPELKLGAKMELAGGQCLSGEVSRWPYAGYPTWGEGFCPRAARG